jgi:hypothetical protein
MFAKKECSPKKEFSPRKNVRQERMFAKIVELGPCFNRLNCVSLYLQSI